MPSTPPLLTSAEAGAILGKSARTVLRLHATGKLRAAQKLAGPNGAHLFRIEDVQALKQSA